MSKKEQPIYQTDKYGLLYQVNKPLSENDKNLLEQLKQLTLKNKKKMKQRKQRTHSFPKTYTTLGAIYRGKKNFETMFPDSTFVVVKQDGKFVLERIVGEVVNQETNVESVNI